MFGPRPWPDVHRAVAGGVGGGVPPSGPPPPSLRGEEGVANLYTAVRARDWGILPAIPVGGELEVGRSGIVLRREEKVGDHLRSVLDVSWKEPGILTAAVTLTALADVEINRWGFNTCLDA